MPNGADKLLNFTLKVWDDTAKAYRPVYIAPDATNAVQGDVKLSDAVNSTLDAANGMTAATPKAVKTVQDSANNKLDKTTGTDQTVASKVAFSNSITVNKGVTVPTGQFFTGNLSGNATTATTLQTSRKITLTGRVTGSANFNGGADASIATTIAAGSITGTDLADNSITSAKIVDGTIASADVGFNYAGSSSKGGAATSAAKLTTARTITLTGDVTGSVSFDGSANVSLASTLGAGVVGTNELAANAVTSAKIADGTITSADVGFNYAGSSSKGGAATSAAKVNGVVLTNQNLNDYHSGVNFYYAGGGNTCTNKPSGVDNFGMFVFQSASGWWTQILYGSNTILYSRYYSGSSWSSWKMVGEVADGSITTAKLADNAVTTAKLSNSSVTSAKIVDGTIVAADIADATITGAKIANTTISGGKLVSGTITATQLANDAVTAAKIATNAVTSDAIASGAVGSSEIAANAVTLAKLGSDVGTVAVQSSQPTDDNVKIWVQI